MSGEAKLISGVPSQQTFGMPTAESMIDPTWGALRASLRPDEYNFAGVQGGHFRIARSISGITGYAAGALVTSFRWGVQNLDALIKRVSMGFALTTVFTTAQPVDFDLIRATGFTVADTGGVQVNPFTGTAAMARTKWMNQSQVADFREPAAAGGALTAGTKTLDASPLGASPISIAGNTLGVGGMIDLYKLDATNQHPLMLKNNEGFNIRLITAMGAAGIIRIYYVVEWAEVPGI